jgi:outer membrane protein TolC
MVPESRASRPRPARGVLAWCALFAGLAFAAPPLVAQTLTLGEVLASSREHAPQVLEAMARVRSAEGRRLSADGAFDVVFRADGDVRLGGFYDGSSLGGTVTRPLQSIGGEAYAGYSLSNGRFPVYEDEKFTNELGELKVGVLFALLRDRMIDDRRFAVGQADLDVELARNEQLLVAIGVQRRAIDAYGNWVTAGLRLQILRDLLKLAEERQDGFRRQVERGLRPRILLTENDQTVLRRQSLVIEAEQALLVAANRLSLFLRGPDGTPEIPATSRLPSGLPPTPPVPEDARLLAAGRPDLKAIDLRMEQARQRLALARNAFLPRLDVVLETSRDLGDPGVGGNSRSGTEPKVGLRFSVPLERRTARGQMAASEAEIDAQERRRQQLEEQIGVELQTIQSDIVATRRIAEVATAEQARAAELAVAERRRFELGTSDLFVVQIREETEANARIRALDAGWRALQARAELAAVAADLEALGL